MNRLIGEFLSKINSIDRLYMELEHERDQIRALEQKLAEQCVRLDDMAYRLGQSYVTKDDVRELEDRIYLYQNYTDYESKVLKDYILETNESKTDKVFKWLVIGSVMALVIWLVVAIKLEWL